MSQDKQPSAPLHVVEPGANPAPSTPPPPKAKNKPTRYLPTDRVTFTRQMDIIRAYAAASNQGTSPVTVAEVAKIVNMSATTIPLANTFFVDTKLLTRGESGQFLVSPEVLAYANSFAWDAERAGEKLAPIFSESWFYQELKGKLSFRAVDINEAISDLAGAIKATTEYRPNLAMLIDFLEVAGLIQRDGNNLRFRQPAPDRTATTSASDETPTSSSAVQAGESKQVTKPTTVLDKVVAYGGGSIAPTQGAVQFHVSIKVDMAELSNWSADRISAFFAGLAQVLNAKKGTEES